MRGANLVLAGAMMMALPAQAADSTDLDNVVQAYNKDFSPALCAAHSSIIDDFGQHYWPGPSACADWGKSFDADSKARGVTDAVVTPGKPVTTKVDGDHAYAVYSARYDFKLKGKPMHEKGTWTLAFERVAGKWLIASWAWGQL